MPPRDYSVMPVLVVDQERVSLPRAVRTLSGSTRPGDRVTVEFGASWATIDGRQQRVAGVWHACTVVRVVHSELHVALLPTGPRIRQEPPQACICNHGWLCEDHPELPMGHGCGGAGMPCTMPACPQKWDLPE